MFTQEKLPYSFDSLEPQIDSKTMEIHYGKHHAGYVEKLNSALEGRKELQEMEIDLLLSRLEDLPEDIRKAVRNSGGGHYNHTLFWKMMSPDKIEPSEGLLSRFTEEFGSFDNFKEEFSSSALNQFGSGWAWLVKDDLGKLSITSTQNQDSPVMEGAFPLLGLDVWEHAYYLKYQNRRADYIDAWWNIVNWKFVEERLLV